MRKKHDTSGSPLTDPSGAAGQLSLPNVVLFVICPLAERQLHIPTC